MLAYLKPDTLLFPLAQVNRPYMSLRPKCHRWERNEIFSCVCQRVLHFDMLFIHLSPNGAIPQPYLPMRTHISNTIEHSGQTCLAVSVSICSCWWLSWWSRVLVGNTYITIFRALPYKKCVYCYSF